jgi:hypothetical protein
MGDDQRSGDQRHAVATTPGVPLRAGIAAWRERRFATLSIAVALGLFKQIGLFTHLFSLLAPALGEGGAGASISLVTLCAVLGRTLLGGLLLAHADRRIAAAANFAVQIAGSITGGERLIRFASPSRLRAVRARRWQSGLVAAG